MASAFGVAVVFMTIGASLSLFEHFEPVKRIQMRGSFQRQNAFKLQTVAQLTKGNDDGIANAQSTIKKREVSQEQINESQLWQLFNNIDTDHGGKLDRKELVLALRNAKKTEAEICRMLDGMASTELDFSDFKKLFAAEEAWRLSCDSQRSTHNSPDSTEHAPELFAALHPLFEAKPNASTFGTKQEGWI